MVYLIVNPYANNGKAREIGLLAEKLLREGGFSPVISFSDESHSIETCSRVALDAGAEAIFLVGGDGSIGHCAKILAGSGLPLGIIPGGTGNDFARALGLPKKPEAAIRKMLGGEKRVVDLIRWKAKGGKNGIITNSLGCGVDVDVLLRQKKYKAFGKLSYLFALLDTAAHFNGIPMRREWEGENREDSTLLLFAANGPYIGSGIGMCPPAIVDDGLMDILYIEGLAYRRLWHLLTQIPSGKFLDAPEVHWQRIAKWRLPGEYQCEIDGEIQTLRDIHLTVDPGALTVFI